LDDDRVMCEGHGSQAATLVCIHLVEAKREAPLIGFHWSSDEGDLVANCDACEELCDAEGYFPDDLVEETFVVTCRGCFVEIASVNGVTVS
jgi:hypothetical protein